MTCIKKKQLFCNIISQYKYLFSFNTRDMVSREQSKGWLDNISVQTEADWKEHIPLMIFYNLFSNIYNEIWH